MTVSPAFAALLDALSSPSAAPALRDLDDAGTLQEAIPELGAGRGFDQPELHFYTVLDHNLATVAALDAVLGSGADGHEFDAITGWFATRDMLEAQIEGYSLRTLVGLGCLLHDVAKPATATMVDGRLRFPRHGPAGAEMMADRLVLCGLPDEAISLVTKLIRYHLRPGDLVKAWPPTDHAVRRFATALDGHVVPLMLVNLCDGMATRGPRYTRENFRRHLNFMNYVVARSLAAFPEEDDPLITGDDLIAELDLQSGRLLGDVLASVRKAAHDGVISSRDDALALARSLIAESRQTAGPS